MNKSVVSWSAVLLVSGVVLSFLPGLGPWVAPVFVVSSWFLVLLWGRLLVAPSVEVAAPILPPSEPASHIEYRDVVPPSLQDHLQKFRGSVELLGGLKGLVVRDTEEAVVRLTQALFALVENSKEVSAHLERSLAFITDGDSGLGKTVANLDQQVKVFESLANHFHQVKAGLGTDIDSLTRAVGSINQFSGVLSDLADQTNVLAINASIEAARVGVQGRGFAVIANHVQSLAKSSKDISDKMAQTVREVVGNVEASFARQTRRIDESEILIHRSESELRRWADHVGPQVAEVQAMIGDSRKLAEVVTQELGDVTVSLQFQDRTRQILDHMAQILEEDTVQLVKSADVSPGPVPPAARQAAFETASRHFTIREEWSLGPSHGTVADSKSVELF